MKWNWFKSWKRDVSVLAGIILVCAFVWFGAPTLFETLKTSMELPQSIPTSLNAQQQEKSQKTIKELEQNLLRDQGQKGATTIKLAYEYEQLGLVQKAARMYRGQLRAQPHNAEILFALARLYERAGQNEQAQIYYEQSYDLSPSSRELYEHYAAFLITTSNDIERARGVYLNGLLQTHNDAELIKQFVVFLEQYGYGYEAKLYKEYLKKVASQ